MKMLLQKNTIIIARVAMVAIFLALIRTIGECFRLNEIAENTLPFEEIKPFLTGAMITAVSCLIMVLLSFFSKYRLIIVISILTIIALIIIKIRYL
ncbi:MAG: hypothetical protein ABIO46_07020 [Chitinophagales bacterium]